MLRGGVNLPTDVFHTWLSLPILWAIGHCFSSALSNIFTKETLLGISETNDGEKANLASGISACYTASKVIGTLLKEGKGASHTLRLIIYKTKQQMKRFFCCLGTFCSILFLYPFASKCPLF